MSFSKCGGWKFSGIQLYLAPAQKLTQKVGYVWLRGLLFFYIIFVLFTSPHCTTLNKCPIKQHTLYSYLTAGLKYLQACGLALNNRPLGLSTSDNNKNNNKNNSNNELIIISFRNSYNISLPIFQSVKKTFFYFVFVGIKAFSSFQRIW